MSNIPSENGHRPQIEQETGERYRELPQYDRARQLFDRSVETAASVMESVRRDAVTAATASDIVRAARHGLGALLEWHRLPAREDESFADILRRAENLAAAVSTQVRVIAPIEASAGKDTLSQPEHENVRSAAFTLRNLLEVVASHLPASITTRTASPKLPS
jgi:hypothetical protein